MALQVIVLRHATFGCLLSAATDSTDPRSTSLESLLWLRYENWFDNWEEGTAEEWEKGVRRSGKVGVVMALLSMGWELAHLHIEE